jgi:hypothetical protein
VNGVVITPQMWTRFLALLRESAHPTTAASMIGVPYADMVEYRDASPLRERSWRSAERMGHDRLRTIR